MPARHAMVLVFLVFEIILGVVLHGASVFAELYREPPQSIVDLIDAPPPPGFAVSPNGKWVALIERSALPGIDDLSRRMLRLAGMRLDPAANSQFRQMYDRGLSLRRLEGGEPQVIPLPAGGRLAGVSWAHDSGMLAFVVVTDAGSSLWVVEVAAPGSPRRLTDRLAPIMNSLEWLPDAKHILCSLVPDSRGPEPAAQCAPSGPNVQETAGDTSPTRTYQDLLSSPYDEALFAHYATTQLAILGWDGSVKNVGAPQIIASAQSSPDGQQLLVTTIQRPFSYLLTASSFPKRIEVWSRDGQVLHTVAEVPMEENIPIEGVRTGPRSVEWQSGRPATLVWFEALDGGDPRVEAPYRDRLMSQSAPFQAEPQEVVKLEHRAYGVSYLADANLLITYEYDRDRRWMRSLLQDVRGGSEPKVLVDRSIHDRYGDPGRIVMHPDATGHSIAVQHGDAVFRVGAGASPQGMLPFLDRQDLQTLATERLWRCEPGWYESVSEVLPDDDHRIRFVTSRQSPTEFPNYFMHSVVESAAAEPAGSVSTDSGAENSEAENPAVSGPAGNGDVVGDDAGDDLATTRSSRWFYQPPQPITDFADPNPEVQGITKLLVTYERPDGVPLSATMYLPPGYEPGTRLPLLVWAYPIEFNDADTAGQVIGSPWQFTRIRGSSHLALLLSGYAVMDGATMPIIGDPETMNDTFIEQSVAAAQAAIDKAVEMGVADRDRVAVGGHSYGAFMTANLMAHCDLFRAGIARSGAYNRTLTPFGFQSERRPLWEAKEVYFGISPFMHADKINEPLLLIHGEADNNPGTFPVQSTRLFQAIKGTGGTARLVMLPEESHGYSARESVLHVQAEMLAWLDRFVKNAPAAENKSLEDEKKESEDNPPTADANQAAAP